VNSALLTCALCLLSTGQIPFRRLEHSRKKKWKILPPVTERDGTFFSARDVVILRIVRTLHVCANRICVNVSYRVNILSDHNLPPFPSAENNPSYQHPRPNLTSTIHTKATSPSPPLPFLPSNQPVTSLCPGDPSLPVPFPTTRPPDFGGEDFGLAFGSRFLLVGPASHSELERAGRPPSSTTCGGVFSLLLALTLEVEAVA
jgi:hypothetical protein